MNRHEQEPAEPPHGGRWRLRNWRLRRKLAAVLIVPMTAALAFAGFAVVDQVDRLDRLDRALDQIDLTSQVSRVVHELQRERTLAVARMVKGPATPDALASQAARVDSAVLSLRNAVKQVGARDDAIARLYRRGVQRLDALDQLRTATTTTSYPVTATFVAYTSVLGELVRLQRELNLAEVDRELLRQGATAQAVTETKEYVAQENAALQIAAGRQHFPAGLLERTRSADAGGRAAADGFLSIATPHQQQDYSDTVSGPHTDGRERIKAAALVRATAGDQVSIDAKRLSADGSATTTRLRQVERALLGELRTHAVQLGQQANRTSWIVGGVLAAMLVATLLLLLVIARSLVNPLRTLRGAALDVAYVRLPETLQRIMADPDPLRAAQGAAEPVPVHTSEEIGEVARSFDAVQESAIQLATEQALLRENVNRILVNLSRRSQLLVERQLGVIDRLEAGEQDPDQLASLFELDLLAARLRRNGESLLVLSGERLTRAVIGPLPAADVVRAAVSEVEQFARIEVVTVPEVAIHSRAVNDLVHLLAELLENATYFSGPDTTVVLRSVLTRQGTLAVQITDRGVGMTDDELVEVNRRLREPPELDLAVTRRMGLYVVARLAQLHGISVRLRGNEDIDGGVIARVEVPAAVLSEAESPDLPVVTVPAPSRNGLVAVPWPHLDRDKPSPRPRDAAPAEAPDAVDEKTVQLPIYDSVVSTWFTESDAELGESGEESAVSPDDDDWFSPSDAGWEAARALLEPREEEVTPAGLPKRVPNAQLVPGSIEYPQQQVDEPAPVRPDAKPAAVGGAAIVARARMDGFQSGWHEGRQAVDAATKE